MKQLNIFNTVRSEHLRSNMFDLSHSVKLSGKMGNLMPVMCEEAVPGDRFNLKCDSFIRFQPMISPVMHEFNQTVHYFFVPNRLLWDNWEKFISQQSTGGIPMIQVDGTWTASEQLMADYLGVPPFIAPNATTPTTINALPFAAYQLIYDVWYRDQNLIASNWAKLVDGTQARGVFATLRKRAWMHDYFTAALPTTQFGSAISLPLGNVRLSPNWVGSSSPYPRFVDRATGAPITGDVEQLTAPDHIHMKLAAPGEMAFDPQGSLEVTPTTINSLRRAEALQKYLEAIMRGGHRYYEFLETVFNVRSQDARLQRPEYITGTSAPVIISEVLNTGGDNGAVPQGTLAGHGVSVAAGYNGAYEAKEHGWVIAILSVMPKPQYQQMLPKKFTKTDPLEFFTPQLANIGEQAVLNQEIFAYGAAPTGVFGYEPQYTEYKYVPSRVCGDFRTTLNFWHAGRIFAAQPTLSQAFIEMDETQVNRIFAVSGGDHLLIELYHKVMARRNMPRFGQPSL